MKTKLKMLAAAIAVAASTGSAQAAIATFASGNGEMFLNVRDNVNGLSYVRDLGIFLDNFQPGSESFTPVAPDATLTSFLSGKPSNTLEWSVLAGDAIGGNQRRSVSVPAGRQQRYRDERRFLGADAG
jgi:hypothetical protein